MSQLCKLLPLSNKNRNLWRASGGNVEGWGEGDYYIPLFPCPQCVELCVLIGSRATQERITTHMALVGWLALTNKLWHSKTKITELKLMPQLRLFTSHRIQTVGNTNTESPTVKSCGEKFGNTLHVTMINRPCFMLLLLYAATLGINKIILILLLLNCNYHFFYSSHINCVSCVTGVWQGCDQSFFKRTTGHHKWSSCWGFAGFSANAVFKCQAFRDNIFWTLWPLNKDAVCLMSWVQLFWFYDETLPLWPSTDSLSSSFPHKYIWQ